MGGRPRLGPPCWGARPPWREGGKVEADPGPGRRETPTTSCLRPSLLHPSSLERGPLSPPAQKKVGHLPHTPPLLCKRRLEWVRACLHPRPPRDLSEGVPPGFLLHRSVEGARGRHASTAGFLPTGAPHPRPRSPDRKTPSLRPAVRGWRALLPSCSAWAEDPWEPPPPPGLPAPPPWPPSGGCWK